MSSAFLKNNILTLCRQISSVFISLLFSIYIARLLGPEGQGSYSLVILLPSMLVTFMNFGVSVATVYYIGKDEIDINSLIRTVIILGFALSILSIIIGTCIILLFSEVFFSGVSKSVLIMSLFFLPIMFIKNFLHVVFQGKQNFKTFNLILLIEQLGTFAFVIFLFLISGPSVLKAVTSYFFGQVLSLVYIIFFIFNDKTLDLKKGAFSFQYCKHLFKFGTKAHISNILSFINYRADTLMISFFIDSKAVGIYVIAVNIAEKIWIVSQSASTVLYPKIISSKNTKDSSTITALVNRNVLAITSILGLIIFILIKYLIDALYGVSFIYSATIIRILLPGVILFTVSRILSNEFAGSGRPEINLFTSIFIAVLNISLNIVLIPKYGISGAAIATSISYGFDSIIKVIIFKKLTSQPLKSIIFIGSEDFLLYKNQLKHIFKRGIK